jgi:hypothetical protein
MHMILYATHTITFTVQVSAYRSQVGVKWVSNIFMNEGHSIFCAEDEMNEKKRKGLGHLLIPYETGPLALGFFGADWLPRAYALGWYEAAPLALSYAET